MTADLIEIARGRRNAALTARSLMLCERHERPVMGTVDRVLRYLGL
ncbi:hypothetical protein [Salipiger abyssi]|uniref:Uncharacterized protein n=1 Tax=Salipiger abyssi TaxID=1250539 RepID=A0A1P8USL3_9RHOB|nr:hypothetical protein [Salipiger abyssi]APZ52399.1 hypothetical protein Ga0080574_TMP2065 [Salipiger abyssi]